MIVSIIAAVSSNHVIGKDNDLVWNLPDDMRYFQETTKGHHVIMGRKNYESIPDKWRPLPDRTNVIVTRQKGLSIEGCVVVHSIKQGLDFAREKGETELFIIGGGEIFRQSMHLTDKIYYTDVLASFDGDTYFPAIDPSDWTEISRDHHDKDERHIV